MKIDTVTDFDAALTRGKTADGGYPCYFIAADGETLSFEAAHAEADQVRDAIASPRSNDQWRVVAVEINWEDPDLYCAHSGERIRSAYAEKE